MNWTKDGFLDGKLTIKQPEKGFRAGSDAVLLAAAIDMKPSQSVLDVGCGVGTAGLCLKYRIPAAKMWGLEIQAELAETARQNAADNSFAQDVTILNTDICNRKGFDGLEGPSGRSFLNDGFDHVLSNPPFYAEGRAQASPSSVKSVAHIEGEADLAFWISFCLARVKPKGTLTLIHRSDRLPEILHEMGKGCGSLKIIPLWPNVQTPAKRVLLQGIKSDKGPTLLHPGIVLHEKDGRPTEISEKILRDGVSLTSFLN